MKTATPEPGRKLCDDCSQILKQERYDARRGRQKVYRRKELPAIRLLRSTADSGCPTCALVLQKLQERTGDHDSSTLCKGSHEISLDTYRRRTTSGQPLPPRYALTYLMSHEQKHLHFVLNLVPESLRLRSVDWDYMLDDSSTASDQSWIRCSSWLSMCWTSHDLCNVDNSPSAAYPTRLIDVGSETGKARLCYSSALTDSSPKYVTLSHCWGTLPITKLTAANHESFQEQIPLDILPKTFSDAITWMRRMKSVFDVRYIWIDALCILQDSPEDWRHEGSLMSDIYANAWCNIAAALGEDGRAGLFSARTVTRPPQITITDYEEETIIPYIAFEDSVWDPVKSSPLLKRAWVHQERTLSRRIIHFTQKGIFWECQCRKASEALFTAEVNDCMAEFDIERGLLSPAKYQDWSEGELQSLWSSCVRNYTQGNLSHAEDKLLAIAGLATRIHRRCPEVKYYAGLWDYEIEKQLLWRPIGDTYSHRQEPFRAPSWSWASIDGEIEMSWKAYRGSPGIYLRDFENVAHITNVDVVPISLDPFGQVASGVLHAQGYLWQIESYIFRHYWPNILRHKLKDELVSSKETYTAGYEARGIDIRIRFDCPIKLGTSIYLFPLFRQEGNINFGLALFHSNRSRGTFRRVGLFNTKEYSNANFNVEETMGELKEWDYEAKVGRNNYIIYII